MALTPAQHRAKAEDLAEQIDNLRKGAPLYLALVAEAQLHATLATLPEIGLKLPEELPKPPAVKAATKRAPKLVEPTEDGGNVA